LELRREKIRKQEKEMGEDMWSRRKDIIEKSDEIFRIKSPKNSERKRDCLGQFWF
jgi:hypothetical protein